MLAETERPSWTQCPWWSFSFGHPRKEKYMAKEIVDAISMKRALMRMTYEIIERNKGTENLVLIGIKTRGLSAYHNRPESAKAESIPSAYW